MTSASTLVEYKSMIRASLFATIAKSFSAFSTSTVSMMANLRREKYIFDDISNNMTHRVKEEEIDRQRVGEEEEETRTPNARDQTTYLKLGVL